MITIIISLSILLSVVFCGYSYYIANRFNGPLTSVSASTYYLDYKERWKFLTTLWTMGIINLIITGMIGIEGMIGFSFLASFGIILAGMTMDHAKGPGFEDEVHTWGTIISIVATFLGFIIFFNVWFPAILLSIASGVMYFMKMKNIIWWVEIIAMLLASIGYIIIVI